MSSNCHLLRRAMVTMMFLGGCASSDPFVAAPNASLVIADSTTSTAPATSTAPQTTAVVQEPTTTVPETVAPTTTPSKATTTPYAMPVDAARAGYSRQHHDYPASDVFVECGASVSSPVNAEVLEVRREDAWTQAVDNPATRGGKSVTVLGDDGVRYYFAHFDSIVEGLEPGQHIDLGAPLGLMGKTGRAGACHVHFAISPPCPGKEWSVRRGVIWPWGYLDAWRKGEQASPVEEVKQWLIDHPDACVLAMADPNALDS
jgi:peptidoglycan LD-endopeptidase LytH